MAAYSPGSGRTSDVPDGAAVAPAPGVVLFGRYRLEDRLGEGGMAEVWRAHDEQLDRPVAIKLLHRYLLPDERSRERFAAEARAVAGLSHPGIVTVYDIVVDDQQAAMVLELVEGEPLFDVIASRGRLPEIAAAAITAQVARALDAAHERGLVHRDVKPANVLLSPDGRARLVDFGIARAIDDGQSSLTLPGTIMGTLRYMAPEQLADGVADRATDVFGLGSLLYEMLVARPPFPAATPAALMAQQRQGVPQALPVSPELANLARTALQHDPERRPRSAGRMAMLLERWLENHGASSLDLPGVTAAALAGTPIPATTPGIPPRPWVTPDLTPAPILAPEPPRPTVPADRPAMQDVRASSLEAAPVAPDPAAAAAPTARPSRRRKAAGPAPGEPTLFAAGESPSDGAPAPSPDSAAAPPPLPMPTPVVTGPDPSALAAAVAAAAPSGAGAAGVVGGEDQASDTTSAPSALSYPSVPSARPEVVDTAALTAPRGIVGSPFAFAVRRVPIVTAVGLAGLLLAGLLIAGALTALQAGTSRPNASPAATHAVVTEPPATPQPTPAPTIHPTAAPVVNVTPVKPAQPKPDKGKPNDKPKPRH
jgi:serine/threonine-protein kinase